MTLVSLRANRFELIGSDEHFLEGLSFIHDPWRRRRAGWPGWNPALPSGLDPLLSSRSSIAAVRV